MTRLLLGIAACFVLLLTIGCHESMTGTVVDAETGQPIEGAVVLVEWTKTKGIGLTYTKSDKVIEVLSDKEGKFRVSAVISPLADSPSITIYKPGYVAWNNEYIFPDSLRRKDFSWQNGFVFKLSKFEENRYGYEDHQIFIDRVINAGLSPEKKRLFIRIYNDNELKKVVRERESKRKGR